MCSVWAVDGQNTPHTRLRGVTSILNHATAILCCNGIDQIICDVISTKVPDSSRKLLWEVAIKLTA